MNVGKVVHFSAGHRLASPALSEAENRRIYGQCYRFHGHNYTLEVTVRGQYDEASGMAFDLARIEEVIRRAVVDRVDHRHLEAEVEGLTGSITTGENLVRAFWQMLEAQLPPGVLRRVGLVETPRNSFEYYGEDGPLP